MKTTLDEMQAFRSVVETRSITAAAELLGQTASGVSRSLSRLEQKLGTTLLRRSTRRLDLTEEGSYFLEQVRSILRSVEVVEDQMNARRHRPVGKLRVNAAFPFMLHVLTPLVFDFHVLFPEITLELNSSDNLIDLLEQRTDIAIRIGPLRDSSLHARPLGQSRLRLFASPQYLLAHGVPTRVADLDRHRLLGFTNPESLNQWPVRRKTGELYEIRPFLQASSGETLRQLALADNGIVCLADFMTHTDRACGNLMPLLEKQTLDVRQSVSAVFYRNTELASRIQCFLDFISERIHLVL